MKYHPLRDNGPSTRCKHLVAAALLATLAACGPGDETPPPAPSAAVPLIPTPVVAAVIPEVTMSMIMSDSKDHSGYVLNNASTDDTTPTIYGNISVALSEGQKVNIYDGDNLFPDVAYFYLGTGWSFTPKTPLSAGIHTFTAAVASADGTLGPKSAPYVITVAPPPIPPSVSSIKPIAVSPGVPSTFTVAGEQIPLTAELRIVGATCDTPTNRTAKGFTTVCTASATYPTPPLLVYSDSAENNGIAISGLRTITVTTDAAVLAAANAETTTTPTTTTPTTTTPSTTTPTTTTTPSAAIKLTDTGITSVQCYKAGSDTLVSCTSAEAIALNDKQDGMIGRDVATPDNSDGKLGFSYSTVGSYDKTECVKDNITGLTWEGKPASGLRGIENLYTNYGDGRNGDASAYVIAVNAVGLCGFTDWRIPTGEELVSLVDFGSDLGFIDTTWFLLPKKFSFYLSSTRTQRASGGNGTYGVSFAGGSANFITPDNGLYSVRLVRK